jgi:anti-sigma factor RsiW
MTACAQWKDAIAGHALGEAADPALSAHLAACPGCAQGLRESQAAAAQMDETLRRLTKVEPPPFGPERIMARIHEGKPAATTGWWRWAVLAAAAILVAVILWSGRPPRQTDVAALVMWRSPTESLLRPPLDAAWSTMPRLGQGFYEVKPLGEKHAQ